MNECSASPTAPESAARAVEALLAEHGGRLYRIGLRICGDPADAEDLVQETFLNAYKSWDGFRGDASPSTWLYTIAMNACRRQKRLRAGQPSQLQSLDLPDIASEDFVPELPSSAPDPYDESVRRETRELVEDAISALPFDFRMPLVLKEIADLSVAQISSIIDLKPATVKTRLHRARLLLRQALTERVPRRPVEKSGEAVCLDLIQAKQEALDRGVEFTFPPELLTERCASLFATLDLSRQVCLEIRRGALPDDVRRRILDVVEKRGAGEA